MAKVQQKTAGGITCIYDKTNGFLVFNGECTADNTNFPIQDEIMAVKDKTTLTVCYVSGSCEAVGVAGLRLYDANWGQAITVALGDLATNKVKSTTSTFNNKLTNWNFRFDKGTVLKNFTIKVMLTDEVDTEYEQFGVAPSWDYPSEIEAVKEVNLVVSNKNLINLTKTSCTSASCIQKSRTSNAVEIMSKGTWSNVLVELKNLKRNTDYFISTEFLETIAETATTRVSLYGSDTSISNSTVLASNVKVLQKNVAQKINANFNTGNYKYIYMRLWSNATETNVAENTSLVKISNIQLEEGIGSAYSFIENEQQNLTITAQQKMFEYDYFDLENEEEVHAWDEYTINGTEKIVYHDAPSVEQATINDTAYFAITVPKNGQVSPFAYKNIICDKLQHKVTASKLWNTDFEEAVAIQETVRVRIKKSKLTGYSDELSATEKVNLMKAYLAENNLTVAYELAEPFRLAFTKEQKRQAEKINQAKSYKNITHMYCTDSLSANMQVTYRKDLETYIKNEIATAKATVAE